MDYDLAIIGAGPAGLSFDTPANDTDALGFLISNFRIRKATFEEFDTLENVTLIDDSEVRGVTAGDYGATVTLVSGEKIQVSMIVAADTRFSASHRQMGYYPEVDGEKPGQVPVAVTAQPLNYRLETRP